MSRDTSTLKRNLVGESPSGGGVGRDGSGDGSEVVETELCFKS